MNKEELLKLINANPVFHLATIDGDQPRVRAMLLYHADEKGIIFHTASSKDVFKQMLANSKAEMCFNCGNMQIRVTGIMEINDDAKLREEIFAHPTRKFLQAWKAMGVDKLMTVFTMKNCVATTWTMETNFSEKQYTNLF